MKIKSNKIKQKFSDSVKIKICDLWIEWRGYHILITRTGYKKPFKFEEAWSYKLHTLKEEKRFLEYECDSPSMSKASFKRRFQSTVDKFSNDSEDEFWKRCKDFKKQ